MLCVNAPRKSMALIHLLVSLVLVIACTALAFTPLMKIVVTDDTITSIENLMEYIQKQSGDEEESEAKANVQKMIDSMDLENASVSLSVFGFASASKPIANASDAMVNMIKAAMDTSNNNGNSEEADKAAKEALENLKAAFLTDDGEIRPEVRDLVVVLAALAGPMIPSPDEIESGMNEEDIPAMMAKAIPHMIGLVVAILLSVIIPIVYIVIFLVTLITALTNLRTPVEGAAKLAKRLPKSIVHPMSVMLVCCLSATVTYTTSTLVMVILAAVGSLINILFTRLHSWDRKEIAYANVVQGVSLLSIGAYIFLFVNLLKMGVFSSFIGRFVSAFAASSSSSGSSSPDAMVFLDLGMILIAVIFALVSTKYLAKVLRRASLACAPKKKGGARSCHLVYSLFLLLTTIFPMIVLGSTANNGHSFLKLTMSQEWALFYGFIATCLMALTEIALLILKKIFGKGLSVEAVGAVLTGLSEGPVTAEPAAEANAAPEENADAEEAPAEEAEQAAPAEEAAPEEAPAEEETTAPSDDLQN